MSNTSSRKKTVQGCIAAAPNATRPIFIALRALVREAAPELCEVIKWSQPCYEGRGLVCGVSAFKAHASVMFFKASQLSDPDKLLHRGRDDSSGCSVKVASLDEIPKAALTRLIREAVKLDAAVVTKPAPRNRRPELPMPEELATALRQAPKAAAYFEMLPPSCRREYIEWISSAKREETRERRLESAIAMLMEGRRMNEQYR